MTSHNLGEITLSSRVAVASTQITSQLGDESVILGLNDGMYYGLNSVGTRIWELIDRPRSVRDVCLAIQEEYDVGFRDCEEAVLALLRDLRERALVEVQP